MSMRRWVLSPLITAGFVVTVLLLAAAGRGIYQAQVQSAQMNAELGFAAVLVALTVLALNRQTRRRMDAEVDRDRLSRAEAASEERGRSEAALQELLHAAAQARADAERAAERARQLIEELRAAQAQAEAANRAKDEFLAVLSHEMRSPLHAMVGWLALLKQGLAQGRDVSRALKIVERNAGIQTQIVNDLLDVSRIVSDRLVIAEGPLALATILHTAVESARPAAEAKGVALTCAIGPLAGVVVGDEPRLLQVLGNLLGNAVKFTPSGGQVSVTLGTDAGEAMLQVRDTGMGIEPEALPHVFDRFRQADATNTRSYGGLGIGLYLVERLVEMHGGSVAVSSEGTGRGATFTLRLPLQAVAPALPAARVEAGEEKSEKLAGVTVVLVEDEEDSREALRIILESRGAEVHACASAEEARGVLDRVRPDVILSDIGMPEENGHAFIRSVRARGGAHVPAIALTGFASRQDAEEATHAGFDEHHAKPVRTDVLVARLRDLARRGSHRAEPGIVQVMGGAEG